MKSLSERAIATFKVKHNREMLTLANDTGLCVGEMFDVNWNLADEAGTVEAEGLEFRGSRSDFARGAVILEVKHLGSWHRVWDEESLGRVLSKTEPEPQMTSLGDDIADLLRELVEELVQEHCQGGERWNC